MSVPFVFLAKAGNDFALSFEGEVNSSLIEWGTALKKSPMNTHMLPFKLEV